MTVEQAYSQQVIAYPTDVVANIATVPPLDIGNFRSGMIGGTANAATLTFYGCATEGGTYKAIEDSSSVDVSLTLTGDRFAQIPAAVFSGARYIKIINDAAQENFDIMLKS